jgi:hypothetical protein
MPRLVSPASDCSSPSNHETMHTHDSELPRKFLLQEGSLCACWKVWTNACRRMRDTRRGWRAEVVPESYQVRNLIHYHCPHFQQLNSARAENSTESDTKDQFQTLHGACVQHHQHLTPKQIATTCLHDLFTFRLLLRARRTCVDSYMPDSARSAHSVDHAAQNTPNETVRFSKFLVRRQV